MTKPLCVGAFGARGTGKTVFVEQWVRRNGGPRQIIWDFKNDPVLAGMGAPVRSLPELARMAKASAFKLRYVVDHSADIAKQFEGFCLVAWTASRLTMVVPELPEVTKAHRAPPVWRRCVNVGRKYTPPGQPEGSGWLAIVIDAQRPSEVDMSLRGNCDILHCGRLANPSDARSMADFMGCEHTELLRLPDLHWIERRAGVVDPIRGVLSFGPVAKTSRGGSNSEPPAKKTSIKKRPGKAA